MDMHDSLTLKFIKKVLPNGQNGIEASAADLAGIGSKTSLRACHLQHLTIDQVMMLAG
jgi:hypothetical protein|tara:strand:+ start:659 stop:832 length:174 start_codon:yes stop_codon:yes gene_type:complete